MTAPAKTHEQTTLGSQETASTEPSTAGDAAMSVGLRIGDDCEIDASVTLVTPEGDTPPPRIGNGACIRSNAVIYPDVTIGERFVTGHNVLVRERTTIGDDVVVGTNAVVDGHCEIGSGVSMQTGAYVPPETTIGDDVFLGPHAVLTNDPYPLRQDVDLVGPTIEADASIGANATVLPDVSVGERAFVAAGAVVTEDVPPDTLAAGVPATHHQLPESLQGRNQH